MIPLFIPFLHFSFHLAFLPLRRRTAHGSCINAHIHAHGEKNVAVKKLHVFRSLSSEKNVAVQKTPACSSALHSCALSSALALLRNNERKAYENKTQWLLPYCLCGYHTEENTAHEKKGIINTCHMARLFHMANAIRIAQLIPCTINSLAHFSLFNFTSDAWHCSESTATILAFSLFLCALMHTHTHTNTVRLVLRIHAYFINRLIAAKPIGCVPIELFQLVLRPRWIVTRSISFLSIFALILINYEVRS